jgi:outer membrane lipoprotein-sorting protein
MTVMCQTADQIITQLVNKINLVTDYSVTANIKADIPLIRVLPVNASIYFKQKDKFKVVSKGIAILPKQGFTDVSSFLSTKGTYVTVDGGIVTLNDIKTHVLTVIPTVENSDIVLAKLWVDTKRTVIVKTDLTTRGSGSVTIDYLYGTQVAFGLPDKITFTVDVKKFKMPKSVSADINNSGKNKKDDPKKSKFGTITITLSNYLVNKGISDDVFKKKD